MKAAQDIIIKPIVTERSMDLLQEVHIQGSEER